MDDCLQDNYVSNDEDLDDPGMMLGGEESVYDSSDLTTRVTA